MWIGDNAAALGVVVPMVASILSALWAFLSYMNLKERELKVRRLSLYHNIINGVANPATVNIDKALPQAALIYELLNFPAIRVRSCLLLI